MKQRKFTRNLHNSSGRRINNTLDLVDRISTLPDSILGLILSCLPTKDAVSTTILSKRWKSVWMIIHNLDFCHDDWWNKLPEDENMKFVRFVNHVLLHVELLNKFSLVWIPCNPSQVISWINTAIKRNVHHLSVYLYSFRSSIETLEVPISLFSCDSLQYLELNGSICVSDVMVVCLPRLESLKLDAVYFQSEEAFENLISRCPMLNYLHLRVDGYEMSRYSKDNAEFSHFTYIISSTSLRRLELCNDWPLHFRPSLELDASSLEYLKLAGSVRQVFVQGTLSSIVEADFTIQYVKEREEEEEFSEDACNSVVEAVRALDCAKALTLSVDAMWAISIATICLSTKFRRLTKLEAVVLSCYCSSLQNFIQSSDSLEVLTIRKQTYDLARFDLDHSNWTAPIEVSKCLSNSLKEVSFECYSGCDDEREMIGYMLKHGSALEVMQITCDEFDSKGKNMELVKEICMFPRKSPACKVEFIE